MPLLWMKRVSTRTRMKGPSLKMVMRSKALVDEFGDVEEAAADEAEVEEDVAEEYAESKRTLSKQIDSTETHRPG